MYLIIFFLWHPVIAAVLRDAIEVTASFLSPQILWVVSGAEQLIPSGMNIVNIHISNNNPDCVYLYLISLLIAVLVSMRFYIQCLWGFFPAFSADST